jgi:hypothetical protein
MLGSARECRLVITRITEVEPGPVCIPSAASGTGITSTCHLELLCWMEIVCGCASVRVCERLNGLLIVSLGTN